MRVRRFGEPAAPPHRHHRRHLALCPDGGDRGAGDRRHPGSRTDHRRRAVSRRTTAARAARVAQARAVGRGALEVVGDRTQLRLFADGNGNGVLQRDIDRGIDPPLTPAEWLDDQARDVSLRINQDDHRRRAARATLAPGDDPLRIGNTALAGVQSAGQCHERHALRRGASGSTNGDSGIRSDRPCPRVDVRCADAAMAALDDRLQLNAGANAVAPAAARVAIGTPSFGPVSRSRCSTSAAARRSSNPRARLRPGAHTEMQLARTDARASRSRDGSIAATSRRSSRFVIAACVMFDAARRRRRELG